MVQLLAVSIQTAELWADRREEVLAEIRSLAQLYRRDTPIPDATVAMEARVSIIYPLIFNLVEFGSPEDLIDVLWAWYGRDERERSDSNVLFVASAHGSGVGYVWPGGRQIVRSDASAATLEAMLTALSEALNEYFRGPAGDRQNVFDERLAGTPRFSHGAGLWAAMGAHYKFDLLREQIPQDWRPRSIIVFPAHRDPLQAALAVSMGWLAPFEASLAKAEPMRAVRTLSVWPGETQTTAAEVAFLTSLATRMAWRLNVVAGPLDERAFRQFYESPEADLIWVIGHGEQSPFRLDETGLMIGDDQLLTLPRLSAMQIPQTGRRLAVLNICSAGAAQNRGGLAHLSLAHHLVAPAQAVIGHLWPIGYNAALAFGCALALSLAQHNAAEALSETIKLMRQHSSLLGALSAFSPDAEAVHRLRTSRAAEEVEDVLS